MAAPRHSDSNGQCLQMGLDPMIFYTKVVIMAEKHDYEEWRQRLKTERDEINVRMHLAAADVRDDWHELEKRWEHFQAKSRQVKAAAAESAEDVGAALELLAAELRAGYARVRSRLH